MGGYDNKSFNVICIAILTIQLVPLSFPILLWHRLLLTRCVKTHVVLSSNANDSAPYRRWPVASRVGLANNAGVLVIIDDSK